MPELREKCDRAREELDWLDLGYPDLSTLHTALQPFSKRVPDSVVIPTSGAGEGIFLALAALGIQLGDRLSVAVPRPAFGAFEGVVNSLGHRVEPYYYSPQENWALDETRLLECARTCDVVILNSPHNPTGAVLAPELVKTVGATLRDRGRYVISDEVFLLPEDAAFREPLESTAIAIGSLSKMFGMPGLRLGWLVVPPGVAAPLKTLQQYTTLSLNSFAVRVGAAILPHLSDITRFEHLKKNRQLLMEWAKRNSGVVRLSACEAGTTAVLEIVTQQREEAVFERLLQQSVLLAPGRCFGVTGPRPWFRLGYGRETDRLEEALSVIEKVAASSL